MNTFGVFSAQPERTQGILVVDDDIQILKFLTRMLSSLGFEQVYQAGSAHEAHQIWRTNHREISLVISDFVMPEKNGDRMVLEMLKEKPGLKVLLISGNDPVTLDSAIPLHSGHNFLQKPFTVIDMRRSVESLSLGVPEGPSGSAGLTTRSSNLLTLSA
jgi:DNA-binding NtrC family response regulator